MSTGIIAIAAALAIAISTIGPAIGQGLTAAHAMDAIARQPEVAGTIRSNMIIAMGLLESLTIYGLQVASLIGNAFIIEVIFRYPGFSQYSLNVIQNKDPYGIVAVTFVFGIIFAVVNALVDIGVAFLDPRIRINTSE